MKEAGYDTLANQCREKAKKLKGEYREAKDKQGKTETGHINWKFFDVLEMDRPLNLPLLLILSETEDEATDTTPETDNSIKEGQNPLVNNNDQSAQSSAATPTFTKWGEKGS